MVRAWSLLSGSAALVVAGILLFLASSLYPGLSFGARVVLFFAGPVLTFLGLLTSG